MKRLLLAAFAIVATATIGLAQQASSPFSSMMPSPSDKPLVSLAGEVNANDGGQLRGAITATIAPTWHINSNKPLDAYSIATTLALDAASADLVSADFPPHEIKTFAFSPGSRIAVFEGAIRIPFVAKLKPGATKFSATLHYQACNNSVCLPPRSVTTEIATTVVAPSAAATPATSGAGGFALLNGAHPAATATEPAPPSGIFSSNISETFASHGLPLTLLAIFVLGLGLNLTPCVYPLIPITVGFFSRQSDGKRGQRVALSLMYVLGIAITYSTLGVLSALSGRLFGAWLQLPAVLIFFALLMLTMASSMFGAFEITVPHFISDRSAGRAGLAGALSMGLLIGIVAAPCVGPFVISLIGLVAQLGSPSLGFLMFFVLAIGLGVPYLFLGIFSSALSSMPRSGMWMVQIKKAMGFVLIAMAFYFLRPLTGEIAFRYGVAASLLIGAAFLFFTGRGTTSAASGRTVRLACAVLLLVAGIAFAIPRKEGAAVSWTAFDQKALADAAAQKKPVVIDFYADWCNPCKELDHETFTNAGVADDLGRFVRLKANLTSSEDPKTVQLTKDYAIIGVPTVIFLDANGTERKELRLTGFEPPEKFLKRTQQVH